MRTALMYPSLQASTRRAPSETSVNQFASRHLARRVTVEALRKRIVSWLSRYGEVDVYLVLIGP
jgi:hypothetical protein